VDVRQGGLLAAFFLIRTNDYSSSLAIFTVKGVSNSANFDLTGTASMLNLFIISIWNITDWTFLEQLVAYKVSM
jgi:hypothetical protein